MRTTRRSFIGMASGAAVTAATHFRLRAQSVAANPRALKILQMNIWGVRGDWPARRAILKAGLAVLDADIIALSEVVVNKTVNQLDELTPRGFHTFHQSKPELDGQGVALLSRWPLSEIAELDQAVTPRTAGFAATTCVAVVDAPEPFGRVVFANHFPNWQTDYVLERELQTLRAARLLEEWADKGRHVILAGDFTSLPESSPIRFIKGLQSLDGTSVAYQDVWERA